jgi:hypothetical protein
MNKGCTPFAAANGVLLFLIQHPYTVGKICGEGQPGKVGKL